VAEIDIYNEPTTFILGAGASSAFGFPLGPQLKKDIIDQPESDFQGLLDEGKHDLIPSFKEALKYGDYDTIDNFLEQKERYRDLGAYFIVSVIARHEFHDRLFPQHDIYADFYHMLYVESESDSIPPISIVTLNYDRSLEYFLIKNVEYNCPEKLEAQAMMKVFQLPIIHAHGSLGDLPRVPYGDVGNSPESMKDAAERIMIMSDKLEDGEAFQTAQVQIAQAKNIVFLGFGSHKRIMDALLAKTDLSAARVFGTALKIPNIDRSRISAYFDDAIDLGRERVDCATFLSKQGIDRMNLKRNLGN